MYFDHQAVHSAHVKVGGNGRCGLVHQKGLPCPQLATEKCLPWEGHLFTYSDNAEDGGG